MDAGSQNLAPSAVTLGAEHTPVKTVSDSGLVPSGTLAVSAAASLRMADSPLRALAQANSADTREARPFVLFMGSAPELLQMLDLT